MSQPSNPRPDGALRPGVAAGLLLGVLFAGSAAAATPRQEEKGSPTSKLGSIAGLITIQGKPASGIEVALHPRHYNFVDKATATASTDGEGRYQFPSVTPGYYRIGISNREYVTAEETEFEGPGRDASVSDGAHVNDADIELIRGGIISGKILSSDGGPVAGEPVWLTSADRYIPGWHLYPQDNDGKPFRTDANGRYRIYGVPPGRYWVAVGEDIQRVTGQIREKNDFPGPTGRVSSDHYYAATFYPGMTDRLQAEVVDVKEGAQLPDIDISAGRRFRAFTVGGLVVEAETGKPVTNCHIELGYIYSGGSSASYAASGPSDTDSEGRFSLPGFLPGRFYVNAHFDGSIDLYSGPPVDFQVVDGDVEGLRIKAQRGVSMRGTVSVDGRQSGEIASKLSLLQLQASEPSAAISHLSRQATVDRTGSFEINGLMPGNYEVSIRSYQGEGAFSILRVQYADETGAPRMAAALNFDSFLVPVGKEGLNGLQLVLAYRDGRIKIHVDIKNGRLPPGVRLIAWVSGDQGTSMPELDSNGNCSVQGLSPGKYSVEVGDGMGRFTGMKGVTVPKDGEGHVSFVVDASRIKPRNY